MKKILYIANIRLPTEKAHGIQIMKTCEALAKENAEITILIPWRNNKLREDPFLYYKTNRVFSIKKLFSLDLVFLGRIGFWIQSVTFSISVLFFVLVNLVKGEKVVYYSRDEFQLFLPIILGKNTVWEAHRGQNNLLTRFVVSNCKRVVVISNGLKDLYKSMRNDEILVAPDGVDIEQFSISEDKMSLREKLGLPKNKQIVLYTGHLYDWKGARILAEATSKIDSDIVVVFVGGTDNDLADFKNKYSSMPNVLILGRKPHEVIPLYLKSSDILVIPNSAKEDISRLYTSPMKLFEYMASGTPIVASDLPSIREILNEKNAVFFKPDNADSLAETVELLLKDKGKRDQISSQARHDIMSFSWKERSRKILKFIDYV